jgi:hypothetical protein
MTDAERIKASMQRNPNASMRRIAKNLNMRLADVQAVVTGNKLEAKRAGGRSLSEFRAVYDKDYIVPKRIREGLKELGAGWEYEAEFIRQIGVRAADLATYRDMFADHIVNIRSESKRAWAGTVATAKQMREMV